MITSLILCGGLGTRLRTRVADRPKALAQVKGRPFLSYQLDWLERNGISHVILAAGYMAEQIEEFASAWRSQSLALEVVKENEPLGSGGAIANAINSASIEIDRLLAINGDTLLDFDVATMLAHHLEQETLATMAVSEVDDVARYGTVELLGTQVRAFHQASGLHASGKVNAGAYMLERSLMDSFPLGPFSMERDCFPALAERTEIAAYILPTGHTFFDIGTPQAFDQINQSA